MSKVTVRKAALLTGKSRETINSATKDGTISYTLNARKHKVIDVAELQRVYPLVRSVEEIEQSDTVKFRQNRTASSQLALDKDFAILKERLASLNREKEMLNEERIRERRQLESEIENLRTGLTKSQEQQSKTMLLLTDQREYEEKRRRLQTEQEQKLKALEDRVKELQAQNRKLFQHGKEQKRQLEYIQNRSIWRRIFTIL